MAGCFGTLSRGCLLVRRSLGKTLFIRALVIFINAIRTNEVEWIAHRVRQKRDGKPRRLNKEPDKDAGGSGYVP